ncbi:ABC transporter ATP-binding protein [Streptomyces sp. NPDC127117]|uniref:ABC transporter ATP-binding protein n=1 Tax=Streptomyces sp. NPDC127117 TaxID=3345368 RepID=UPI0036372F0A
MRTELRASPSWTTRLIRSWAAERPAAVCAVVLALVGAGIDLTTPLVIGSVVDGLATGRAVARWALVLLLVAAVLRFVVQFGQRATASRLATRVQHELRVALLASLCRYSGEQQDALRRGEVVSRSVTDLQVIQALLALAPQAAAAVCHVTVQIVVMFVLSPVLALATLVTVPLAGALVVRSRRRIHAATWLSQQAAADLTSFTGEAVAGLPVTKVFQREDLVESRFRALASALFGRRRLVARLNSVFTPVLITLPQFALVLVIGIGGAMTLRGDIGVGTFVVFATYLLTMTGLVRLLAGVVSATALARSSADRIHAVIDSGGHEPDTADDGSRARRGGGLGVVLSDVGLTLGPEARDVLRGMSLTVAPGECLGIAGRAGAGKSVLGLLLQGQYRHTSGRVELVDRAGGSRAAAPGDPDAVLVAQEPFLFSGTIRDNILLGRDFRGDRYASAVDDAAVDTMLGRMPDGDRTHVGEGGARLSGGERQRIALARALYNSPGLLVLDDATSALDTLTEARVLDALRRRLRDGCTVVVTGRRRVVLSLADRIAVVEGGRVVEHGGATELMQRSVRLKALMGEETGTPTLGADEIAGGERGARGVPPANGGPVRARAGYQGDPAAALGAYAARLPVVVDEPTESDLGSGRRDGPFGFGEALRPVRLPALAAVVCIGVEVVAAVTLPAVARAVLGRSAERDVTAVGALFALGLAVTAVSWVAGWGTIRTTTLVCDRVLFAVRLRCFRHIQRLPLSYVDRVRSGGLLTRMTADIDSLSAFVQTGLLSLVVNLLLVLGVGLVVVWIAPGHWPVLAGAGCVVLVGTAVFQHIVSRSYPRARELLAAVNADLHEKAHGIRTAQIFGCTGRIVAEFAEKSAAYRDERRAGQRAVAWFFPLVALTLDMALISVLASDGPSGAGVPGSGTVADGGTVTALILYLSMLYYPIQQIATVYDSAQQARVGFRRVNGLLSEPTEEPTGEPVGTAADKAVGEPVGEAVGGAPAGASRVGKDIRFDRVGFKYQEDAPYSLLDVVLDIPPGTSLAVVGPTGAGKSTIIKLLARFYRPQLGTIRVGGVDADAIPLRDYRLRTAIVPQEAHLFSGSVGENIAFGRPGVSPAEIMEIVRSFGVSELIDSLPGGLDYDIGPRGTALSAGQRQVVAVLRALVSSPELLLLDEATGALDLESERSVVNALRGDRSGRKTVLVAHRLATAAQADVIAVVERGRLLEVGGHESLLGSGGLYAELWAASGHDGTTIDLGRGGRA